MRISGIELTRGTGSQELAALIDGQRLRAPLCVLRRQLWKFELRELAIAADRVLLRSTMKRMYMRTAAPDWQHLTAPGGRRR